MIFVDDRRSICITKRSNNCPHREFIRPTVAACARAGQVHPVCEKFITKRHAKNNGEMTFNSALKYILCTLPDKCLLMAVLLSARAVIYFRFANEMTLY